MAPNDFDMAPVYEQLKNVPSGTPFVLMNLLRYRDLASYDEVETTVCTGREAYGQYLKVATRCSAALGITVRWSGTVLACLQPPVGERWDEVLLVEYPSLEHLSRMLNDRDYLAAMVHRDAALADTLVLVCAEAALED